MLGNRLPMARPSSVFALPALSICAFVALGCENDEAPKPEPTKPAAVAPQAPAAAAPLATAKAGGCGMGAGHDEQAGGCGQAAKAEAPAGCGCAGHDTGSADRPVVPASQAKLGDRTRCPVTSSVFVVKTDSPKADHGGKTYHFCCEGCVTRFRKDPKQYLES